MNERVPAQTLHHFTVIMDEAALSELQPSVHYSARFGIWLLLVWLPQCLRNGVLFRICIKGMKSRYFHWEISGRCLYDGTKDISRGIRGQSISVQAHQIRLRMLSFVLEKNVLSCKVSFFLSSVLIFYEVVVGS
jgi:hypothetical protein